MWYNSTGKRVSMRKNSANYKKPLIMLVLLMIPAFLTAQTARELETVLEAPAVTCAQAAYFVYSSREGSTRSTRPETAFEQALERGWVPQGTTQAESITLGKLSLLLMKAYDIKGGMMYAIFPGPRYAFKTMVSRSFIQGTADPSMTVSGEQFLLILGNVLEAMGANE